VKQLALQYSNSSLNKGPLLVYLTSRDQSRGETAVASLTRDAALGKAKALSQDGGRADIRYHQLDISDSSSIERFGEHLKSAHPDGVDFVINNAGVAFNGFGTAAASVFLPCLRTYNSGLADADKDNTVVKQTLGCNYHGTLEATRTFLPLMKPGGRIVSLASMVGRLGRYSASLQERFRNPASVDAVTELMDEFAGAVRRGKEKEEGWPSAAYAVSKAGIISMTRALAKELEKKGPNVEVTCCCPGWVVTDLTKGRGTKTVDQGAQTPVLLALQGSGGNSGSYWTNEKIAEW
jgi:carbonyl reductase 1